MSSSAARFDPPVKAALDAALPAPERCALRTSVIPSLLTSIASVARILRSSHHVGLVGTANTFGDDQLNVDVLTEDAIRDVLRTCRSVVTASSEEDPIEKSVHAEATGEQYTVAFDPLDGSSIIAPNWTVGTIFGIWDGSSALSSTVTPRERLVVSILGVLGPRTTAFVGIRVPGKTSHCFEIGLADDDSWRMVRPEVRLAAPPFRTRYFAPANLRLAADNPAYMALITRFIEENWTLRYCGGLVPDIGHALTKGHGLYVNPVGGKSLPKLRRLYELCPIALMIECAGGRTLDPTEGQGVLDQMLEGTDERGGLLCGTAEEVEIVIKALLD